MDDIKRAALRKAASEATQGEWVADEATPYTSDMGPFDDFGASVYADHLYGKAIVVGGAQDEQGGAVGVLTNEDARYIALAHPAAILALLDECERMREALTALQSYAASKVRPAGAHHDPVWVMVADALEPRA